MKTKAYFANIVFEKVKSFSKKLANTAMVVSFLTAGALFSNFASAQNVNNTNKSSLADVIETGYGEIYVKDSETNNPISNATLTLTPISVPGDSTPDPYVLTGGPSFNYEVLTFSDLGIGLAELAKEQITSVRPSVGSDFTLNYFSQDIPSSLTIRDIQGRTIKEIGMLDMQDNIAEFYVDLSSQADGMYFATSIIDGKQHTEKLMKITAPTKGKLPAQNLQKSSTSTLDDAVYQMTITADGYQHYQENISVSSGPNDLQLTYIDPITGPPQSQDLTGSVLHQIGTSITDYPLATVYVKNNTTGAITSITADENANWVYPNADLNTTYSVSFEGTGTEWSPEEVYYTTPVYDENTWTASDTIHHGLDGIIMVPVEETTLEHFIQQSGQGTNILYWDLCYFLR